MTSRDPLVSVVIIFLNAERFLRQAVDSVFAQTYTKWELLLVDDGSTDGSADEARRLAATNGARVKYLTHWCRENRGMSASRNLGISRAAGEFIALLDADDVWLPHKLERQIAILQTHRHATMLYGAAGYWHEDDPARDFVQDVGFTAEAVCAPPALALKYLTVPAATPAPSTVMLRSSLVRRIGGFVDDFRGMYEDQAFCVKVALQATIAVSPECWVRYRQHEDSCCSKAFATNGALEARRAFLRWCRSYLDANAIDYPALRTTLNRELRNVRPRRRAFNAARHRVARLLPTPVRTWLRAKAL